MRMRLCTITALSTLGAIVGCHTPQVPLLTADRVTTVSGARSVDALWMLALPPVVVQPAANTDTVRIVLSEWKIELSAGKAAPGTVVFRVLNKGTMPHAFEIEGEGVEREIPAIRPGVDTLIAIGLHEGKYDIYCPIGENTAHAHKAMGMVSALRVGSPSASGG